MLDGTGVYPHVIVFLAMTRHQLGDTDKAKERLQQLRNINPQRSWADTEMSRIVKEAEALIETDSKPDAESPQVTPPKQP